MGLVRYHGATTHGRRLLPLKQLKEMFDQLSVTSILVSSPGRLVRP